MPVDIKRFTSIFGKVGGAARPSHYVVEVTSPALSASNQEILTFLCEGVTLPGKQIMTDDTHMPQGFGTVERMAWGLNYGGNTINLNMIADTAGFVMTSLNTLMNSVVSHNVEDLNGNDSTGAKQHTMKYPSSYRGTVKVHAYDPLGKQIMTHTFTNAFISAIGSVSYSSGESNSYLRVPVTFSFSRILYKCDPVMPSSPGVKNVPAEAPESNSSSNATDLVDPASTGSVLRDAINTYGQTMDLGIISAVNRLELQLPPELQSTYAQAIPLLGGSNNFRF